MAPRDIHELVQVLPNIDVSDVMEIPSVFECDDQTLPCDHTSKFRTATGWCNNLNNPGFGKAVRALNRLVRPHYGDGGCRGEGRDKEEPVPQRDFSPIGSS